MVYFLIKSYSQRLQITIFFIPPKSSSVMGIILGADTIFSLSTLSGSKISGDGLRGLSTGKFFSSSMHLCAAGFSLVTIVSALDFSVKIELFSMVFEKFSIPHPCAVVRSVKEISGPFTQGLKYCVFSEEYGISCFLIVFVFSQKF